MTPVFAARRRAEEFDSLLEGPSTERRTDPRYAEFLEVVEALRAVPAVEPRPEFVSALRERLMTAADLLLVPAEPEEEARLALPARRPTRERRIATAVGSLAVVGATTTMAVAAQSALPGDVLYPLKRAIENAQSGLSVDDGEKGSTLLANATGRLEEATELSREGRPEDGDAIAETLNTFTEQAIEASDLLLADYSSSGQEESITELHDFTATSMEALADLESLVPVEARDELLHAARVLTQIDAEAAQACPSCAGAGISEIPAILTTSAGFAADGDAGEPKYRSGDGSGGKGDKDPAGAGTDAPELPEADGDDLTPGSVLEPPTQTDTSTPSGGDGAGDDPIGDLTDGLVDGNDSSTSNDSDPLDGVTDELDDATDDLTDPLTGD